MSQESPASPPAGGRSKFLPAIVAGVAIAGAAITWIIASPSATQAGPAVVGQPAPDFDLESTAGPRFKLSDQRGREVLLVFFRTHT